MTVRKPLLELLFNTAQEYLVVNVLHVGTVNCLARCRLLSHIVGSSMFLQIGPELKPKLQWHK